MTKQLNENNEWAKAIDEFERTGKLSGGTKAVTRKTPRPPKFVSVRQRRALYVK